MADNDDYRRAFEILESIGRRPYVVNEKDARFGYQRRWNIYVPPGRDGEPAERHQCRDDHAELDRLLLRIAHRLTGYRFMQKASEADITSEVDNG